jgi:hypothetical protein
MAASALSVENGVGFQHTPHEIVTGDEKVCGEDSSSNFAVTAIVQMYHEIDWIVLASSSHADWRFCLQKISQSFARRTL